MTANAHLATLNKMLKLEPLADIVQDYRNVPGLLGEGPDAEAIAMEQLASLERYEPTVETAADPKAPQRFVFRAVVSRSAGNQEYTELADVITVPNRLMQTKREDGRIRPFDIVTGRMVPNGDPRVATPWMAIHVLRIDSRLRKALERKARVEAQCWRIMDMDSWDGLGAHDLVATAQDLGATAQQDDPGACARAMALQRQRAQEQFAKNKQLLDEKATGGLRRACAGSSFAHLTEVLPTPEQVEAGFTVMETLADGKVRFEGIVGVHEDSWAILSRAVYLNFSQIASRWGAVVAGDRVCGLLVPEACGGCLYRCIHVFAVDRGGLLRARREAELDALEASRRAAHEEKARELATQDHKAEIEKLKAAAQARREEEKRKEKEARQRRREEAARQEAR